MIPMVHKSPHKFKLEAKFTIGKLCLRHSKRKDSNLKLTLKQSLIKSNTL